MNAVSLCVCACVRVLTSVYRLLVSGTRCIVPKDKEMFLCMSLVTGKGKGKDPVLN